MHAHFETKFCAAGDAEDAHSVPTEISDENNRVCFTHPFKRHKMFENKFYVSYSCGNAPEAKC